MAALHVRDYFAGEINRAHEIRIQGAAPFFETRRKKSFCRRTSGVSDANVYAAKFRNYCLDKVMYRLCVGYVHGLSKHFSVMLLLNALRCRVKRLSGASAHSDTAPLGGEGRRRRLADPLARSSNNRDSIFQACFHVLEL